MAVLGKDHDQQSHFKRQESDTNIDYFQRKQWLQSVVLGANNGLVSTASLMMGVGALKEDQKAMIRSGFAGLVAGAFSIAMREFTSVYSVDIKEAQIKRESEMEGSCRRREEKGGMQLPSPLQAAATSALSFSLGAMLPILAAAFIKPHKVRLGVVAGVVTLALIVLGGLGGKLGRSGVSMFLGGWIAILLAYGLMKLYGSHGL